MNNIDYLYKVDPEVASAVDSEFKRQKRNIELIASENIVSEGVLAAAAIKCLGGDMQARLCPEDEAQVKRCLDMGIGDVNKVLTLDDMVKGDDCMFTATAITECQLLNGLRYFGGGVRTHTVSMRYKTGTVRFVDAVHSFDRKDFAVKL